MFLIFLPLVDADVVSVNSGGSSGVVVSSNSIIEGFFTNLSLCGNSYTEIGEQCDDGNTNNGDGCSSSCLTEATTTTTTGADAGGGGGGSGGSGSSSPLITAKDLFVDPPELSIIVVKGVEEHTEIIFINKGDLPLQIAMEISGDDIKSVLTSEENLFSLNPGQQKVLILKVNVQSEELLTGKIIVKYSGFTKEIPVVIAPQSENFLFDISVFLGSAFKKIIAGNKLDAQFNLLEVNVKEKVDVTATYVIKDFDGNKHYESSETFFVLGEKTYYKEFPTETLPAGRYVLGFEIVYPQAFAVSSATFEVVDPLKFNYKFLIIGITILGTVVVLWLAKRIFFRNADEKQQGLNG